MTGRNILVVKFLLKKTSETLSKMSRILSEIKIAAHIKTSAKVGTSLLYVL
jgi:hypothetical protein